MNKEDSNIYVYPIIMVISDRTRNFFIYVLKIFKIKIYDITNYLVSLGA